MILTNRTDIVKAMNSESVIDIAQSDNIIASISHTNAAGYDYLTYIGGKPEVTLTPKGNTLNLITPDGQRHLLVSPEYNNLTAHNLAALTYDD